VGRKNRRERPPIIVEHAGASSVETRSGTLRKLDRECRRLADLLSVLRLQRPNVLVVGAAIDADSTFDLMRPYLGSPTMTWQPRETPIPPMARCRTLVIRDVDALDADQQQYAASLLRATSGRMQVISISGGSLFPLVQRGKFLDHLYYQLNVVYVDLTEETSVP
jgi:hypothetical protein